MHPVEKQPPPLPWGLYLAWFRPVWGQEYGEVWAVWRGLVIVPCQVLPKWSVQLADEAVFLQLLLQRELYSGACLHCRCRHGIPPHSMHSLPGGEQMQCCSTDWEKGSLPAELRPDIPLEGKMGVTSRRFGLMWTFRVLYLQCFLALQR